jgi:hypothetical protein
MPTSTESRQKMKFDANHPAYYRGRRDYDRNIRGTTNPYPEGTSEHAHWFTGWYDSLKDHFDE